MGYQDESVFQKHLGRALGALRLHFPACTPYGTGSALRIWYARPPIFCPSSGVRAYQPAIFSGSGPPNHTDPVKSPLLKGVHRPKKKKKKNQQAQKGGEQTTASQIVPPLSILARRAL
jgi:hypothetical protein